ncbi:MAG TPA: TetR/AcrR family transcriptional regulator [Fibrobacteria bacterium]|nr:TetR/AcrR family transcriptional regulator [Fibrobacteria bacterium]HOX52254.1 TetR/AcrR family transcriptional regulator [Fibrobacteria bacterium]
MSSPRESKVQHIVDVAEKHFAMHGYSKVTMEDVATELGISKASLYYYFEDKGALFREVFAKIMNAFWDDLSALLERNMTGIERLKVYAKLRHKLFHKYITLAGIGSGLVTEFGSTLPGFLSDFKAKECAFVKRILESDDGFHVADTGSTAELVVGILHGLRLRHRHAGVPMETLTREIEPMLDILVHGLAKR